MNLEEIMAKDSVLNLFVNLAKIPSPSLKEDKVSEEIIKIFKENGIEAHNDSYGNIIGKLPATAGGDEITPVLFSAHMDVVGGMEPVNIRVSEDGKFLETDKTRTLGADDKAGVAAIIDSLIKIKNNPSIKHGLIEFVFTKDEEHGMSGIQNLDSAQLTSEYVVIPDGSYLGECNNQGASFNNLYVSVTEGKGGHSGNDIGDETRVSAVKVIAEIASEIPQGVYKKGPEGVLTSVNAGVITGGSAGITAKELIGAQKDMAPNEIMKWTADSSFLNIIATDAHISYSLRSSDPKSEKELIDKMFDVVKKYQKKYDGLLKIEIRHERHLEPFLKNEDETFVNLVVDAAKLVGINTKPTSFHAGAETHIYQNEKKNKGGKAFKPVLIGSADVFNMHSSDEKMNYESLIIGRNWIIEIIKKIAE